MKKKIVNPVTYLLILAVGLIFILPSCEKEPAPMELPKAETMIIDWNQFPSNSKKGAAEDLTFGNWFYSAASIVIWNTVVAANIAIPTVAYAAAFTQDPNPVYLGDETWEWSYSVTMNQRTIVARLVGSRIDNETFSMEMYLSETGNFTDFQWFTGVIRYDQTEAIWTLSYSPQNPTDYLEIHYQKDFETDVASFRYTVIDSQNDLYDGYVEFGLDDALDYDAHYTISRADTTTNIEWMTETNAGRVKDLRHFGDDQWHCWDSQLQDVDCPEER